MLYRGKRRALNSISFLKGFGAWGNVPEHLEERAR